ncbi:chromate efflux transporter [Rhizobium alvei]
MEERPQPATAPSLSEATRVWARIGLLSFGGPAGQIALMHRELVDERKWVSESRFLHALNFCMLLPGPEAQQLATYIGWLLHGWRGGVVAGTLFVLPGFLVILLLSTLYTLFGETSLLAGIFYGLKAAVLVIVVEALLRVGRRSLKSTLARFLALAAFLALFLFSTPFPLVILTAGLIGLFVSRARPGLIAGPTGHGSASTDDLAPPAPASLSGALKTIAIWGGLWLLPFLVIAILSPGGAYAEITAFFSKMAVVTFGGAYAVLAYVGQQAVGHFGWLAPGEMLDGLGLAETTPGPLVLVLSFVGFLAGYRNPGLLYPLGGGFAGAFLATWVTFVPCFLWIFLGAPHIEKLRNKPALNGALTAISAAVVGVILNLAIWFSLHVLFREMQAVALGPLRLDLPLASSLDPYALVLSVVAGYLLLRLHLSIPLVLGICAAAGLAILHFSA